MSAALHGLGGEAVLSWEDPGRRRMGACGEVADVEDEGEGAAEERREEGHRERGCDLHRWRRHLLACCRSER